MGQDDGAAVSWRNIVALQIHVGIIVPVREPEVTIERREDAETMKRPEYVAIPNLG